ncbi:MAG TPA: AmmeMemoRadiSam system protein A [Syntrophorhabdaceae bacterium]|jgi:AmmeMemoRadiSam system protein A
MSRLNLSEEEKAMLKRIAREAIEGVLFDKKPVPLEMPEIFEKKMGAFVTLHCKEDLRGCIGYIKGVLPLYKTIQEMAVQAAFHDPRFEPLRREEWDRVDIEISVLSPLRKIKDVEEIEVGVHGILIEKGFYTGLLLPQVATENNWDRAAFIAHTCHKAGLPEDAWKSKDASIYIFSAEVF